MEQVGQSISWKVCQSFRTIQCIVKPLCAPPFLGYCKYKNQSGMSEYYKNFELRMRTKHYQHMTSYSQANILIYWLRLSHQVKNSLNMNQSLGMLEQMWQRIPILSCHKQPEPISTPLFWFWDCSVLDSKCTDKDKQWILKLFNILVKVIVNPNTLVKNRKTEV